MTEIAFLPATELAARIRARQIGCLELLDHFLDRVDRHNPRLNAIVVRDVERARARAEAADAALSRGDVWGPLHGVPMTFKESYDMEGLPTTWGLPEFADRPAERDSTVVRRMREAGAVPFGKTNVPVMLADWQSYNPVYGSTNNPWDPGRTPGGSSGGSAAALAAGLTGLEAGSDIGASIRNPAHYCGVYGHKPTYGVVPMRGHALPGVLAAADISVVGPLARSADDLELALDAMAGADGLDAECWRLDLPEDARAEPREFRVAVMLTDPNCAQDDGLTGKLQATVDELARLGVRVSDTARPALDTTESHRLYIQLLRAATSGRLSDADLEQQRRIAAEADPDDFRYVPMVARAFTQGHRDWLRAHERRTHLREAWAAFFREWDLLLCPTAASTAFAHQQEGQRHERTIPVNGRPEPTVDQLFWAGLSSVVYLPSTVVPVGAARDGLPCGLQIIAGHGRDKTALAFAKMMEKQIGGFVPPPGYD
ncbi:amidase [Thalassobaculum fulvum]|uniref:Amidase n=1 Tax=Thalassobaculum fulvum TaxID=1633335 RepID=A0A918XRG4_9PROT|nr:amidase [Thalassobaculum fulvum]GHD48967.1 amidase [Thalassobaculum fulvum]